MPKKRTTRAKATNISKPKENTPKVLSEKEEREKREQLELILKEFDSKANSYQKAIEKQKRAMLAFINQRYLRMIATIGPEIGSMTIKEFAEAGGTIDTATVYLKGKSNTKPIDKVAELQGLLLGPSRGLSRVAEEEGDDIYIKPEPVGRGTIKRTIKSVMPSTAGGGRKSKRAGAATPLNTLNRNQWGQTPLITPKFNPNLPSTPDNIRGLRPGERHMSIRGSPVNMDMDRIEKMMASEADLSPGRMEKVLEIIQKCC